MGNKDPFLERGRNAYKWYYIPPTPVELILGITFGTIFFGVGLYLEIRRRKKKEPWKGMPLKECEENLKVLIVGVVVVEVKEKKKKEKKEKKKKDKSDPFAEPKKKKKKKEKSDGGKKKKKKKKKKEGGKKKKKKKKKK